MASRKLVKEVTQSFGTLTAKRLTEEETQALEDTYFIAFKSHSDPVVKLAVHKYIEDGDFYPPRPKDILVRIEDREQDKHTRELVQRYTCSMCHQKVGAITEGICLDCAGMPRMYYEAPKLGVSEKTNYRIEGRMRCNRCGHIGMCIKEPADENGFWQCRECYTGLTNQEIAARFRKLGMEAV